MNAIEILFQAVKPDALTSDELILSCHLAVEGSTTEPAVSVCNARDPRLESAVLVRGVQTPSPKHKRQLQFLQIVPFLALFVGVQQVLDQGLGHEVHLGSVTDYPGTHLQCCPETQALLVWRVSL